MLSRTLLFIFLFLTSLTITAQDCLLDQPAPRQLVNDYANILSQGEEEALEAKLRRYHDTTSTQILIVTVEDLCGTDEADFTYSLGHKWGVGQKGFNNGLVIMVKPTGGQGQRKTFIATGYGMEATVTDAASKRIVEQLMKPNFQQGNFYAGLDQATDRIFQLASGEYKEKGNSGESSGGAGAIGFLAIMFFFFILIPILRARSYRKKSHFSNRPMDLLTTIMMMNSMKGNRGGGFGDFKGGGGIFGGGGGGFGGFGGGGFGGGGAGGSW